MDFANRMLVLVVALGLNAFISCERPAVVNIGAILAYDSVIGRVAKAAIEAAVADVNVDGSILGGTQLNLIMQNSNCNAFLGAIGALKVLEKDAVAIVGPQTSTTAHTISSISNGLQIPLVSFAATDPALSSLQYPFFLRMTQSDSRQMAAMADLISYYGWRQVIGIYVDNEHGRNGINSLDEELAMKMSKIYKIALPLGSAQDYMMDVLRESKVIGPRVYVVHVMPDLGLEILSVARQLHMMTDEYVWLVTDWLCLALEKSKSFGNNSLNHLQGIVGFCQFVPPSTQKSLFMSKWKDLQKGGKVSSELNAYGFYAYDTVWAIAHALNDFFKDSGRVTFSYNDHLVNMKGNIQLSRLKSFDGGHLLRQKLLRLNFSGLTGEISFDSDQNLKLGVFQIFNIDSEVIRTVGYWTSRLGLTISLPSSSNGSGRRNFSADQILGSVTWHGGKTQPPRGWVAATNEKPLRIAVPYRVSFLEFVRVLEDNLTVKGYCIDVFEAAIKLIPYHVPHQFVPYGDGHSNPNYFKLINMVADESIDAAIGDITISKNRTKIVGFTQPYLSSGLVVVVRLREIRSNVWSFLWPFSLRMWCVMGAYFFFIGAVIWLLEHRVNSDFRGSPKRQCLTIILFSFSTLFHSQENTVSTLGRFVLAVWFFLLMVITSSYTAYLTSSLTIQQLSYPISGIDSLIVSRDPIGYQEGSFAKGYMIDALKIHPSRLVPLRSPQAYAEALQLGAKNGGVAAIVDDLQYAELFLRETNGFGIVGQPFIRRGWGFAFPRGSLLPIDLSSAILKLSESGELKKIHDTWFCKTSCSATTARHSERYQLNLSSFCGLYIVCGSVIFSCCLIFLLRSIRQFIRYKSKMRDHAELSEKGCSEVIYKFFDFLDEKEEAIKNKFKQQNDTSPPEEIPVS